MSRFLKPYKNGYLLVSGNGKTIFFSLQDMQKFDYAYHQLLFRKEEKREKFNL